MALPGGSPLDHDIPDNLPARAKRLCGFPVQFGTHATGIPKSNGELILRLPLSLLTGRNNASWGLPESTWTTTQLSSVASRSSTRGHQTRRVHRPTSQPEAIGAHRRGWWRSNGFHLAPALWPRQQELRSAEPPLYLAQVCRREYWRRFQRLRGRHDRRQLHGRAGSRFARILGKGALFLLGGGTSDAGLRINVEDCSRLNKTSVAIATVIATPLLCGWPLRRRSSSTWRCRNRSRSPCFVIKRTADWTNR